MKKAAGMAAGLAGKRGCPYRGFKPADIFWRIKKRLLLKTNNIMAGRKVTLYVA